MSGESKSVGMCGEADGRVRAIWLRDETEKTLHNAVKMTEVATEMRKRSRTGERTLHDLRRLSVDSRRALAALGASGQDFTRLGAQTAQSALRNLETFAPTDDVTLNTLRHDYEKLLHTLHVDRSTPQPRDVTAAGFDLAEVKDKISHLEQMQKSSQRGMRHLESTLSPPHSRTPSDFDEKYPDLQPRTSLIDLSHITTLQTVPEDAFIPTRRPTRCTSLCSLKSLRRLMKTLQRVEGGGGAEERGEGGTHGDVELEPRRVPSAKSVRLGDIKEELQAE